MFPNTGRFRRADRLLRSQDFKRVVKSGKRRILGSFVVVVKPRDESRERDLAEPPHRLGITVGKRVGNAVVRNRVKRGIREWFRRARAGLPDRSDIVIIARRAAGELSGAEIAAVLDRIVDASETRRSRESALSVR